MRLKLIKFDEKYLENFEYDGIEKTLLTNCKQSIKEEIKKSASLGEAWMGLVNDRVIGLGGFIQLWEGVAHCWLYLNREIVNYKRDLVLILKELIKQAMEKYHRIQAMCLANSFEANNLIKFLGFKEEGLLRQHTPTKEDMIMFSIIREDLK
jgi:hypothetical protein